MSRHHEPEDHKSHGEDAEQPSAAQSPPSGTATSTGLGAERLAAAMAHQLQLQREVQSLTAQMQQVSADHKVWHVWGSRLVTHVLADLPHDCYDELASTPLLLAAAPGGPPPAPTGCRRRALRRREVQPDAARRPRAGAAAAGPADAPAAGRAGGDARHQASCKYVRNQETCFVPIQSLV